MLNLKQLLTAVALSVVPVLSGAQTTIPIATQQNLSYASTPGEGNGHLLDLYLPTSAGPTSAGPTSAGPAAAGAPWPVVIFTGGSAWLGDNGRATAVRVVAPLNGAGFAVAGVSIRSSAQTQYPGQLHDIKAAIRWLRAHAAEYQLDPKRFAIMGDSSGGWAAAMAALTGDVPELEGSLGPPRVSSAVQAAVAFYPPTNFLSMDAWALQPCKPGVDLAQTGRNGGFCHDAADSPESKLVGCAIQSCAVKVTYANPARYISAADPPVMILHGQSDPLVPHQQGELLYQALNKACHDAVFISLPKAGHGPLTDFLTNDAVREAAVMRSTAAAGCKVTNPTPFTPTWGTIIEFLQHSLGSG